ncbi:MAG: TIGR00153 family protein [Candidatus Competibacteraceae bacterium]|nr:TIGR00153 family protein [Candidatus Competibacteraceae bacterium]
MKNFISRIFGSSPMRPLQQHMAKVLECVSELETLFQAVVAQDWEKAGGSQARIVQLEREADRMKKDLRLHLPSRGLVLPVDRSDLLETLRMQDRVANRAKDIAGLVLGRHMSLPEDLSAPYLELIKRSIDAVSLASQTVNELDELVETGFRGHEVKLVESMIERLDVLETDTDRIQAQIRTRLFTMEKDLHAVDVMFLYRIIDWTGDLADRAQRVGHRLQLMVAR